MTEYRKGAHMVYDIKYHLVWVTKYRYKVLRGEIGLRAREFSSRSGRDERCQYKKHQRYPQHPHSITSSIHPLCCHPPVDRHSNQTKVVQ